MTFSRDEQPLNKLNLMIVINGVRMMLLSEVHLEKVKPLIVATESGMSTLTKELHFENAHESNKTTEEGIDTSTSPVSLNDSPPILVSDEGSMMLVNDVHRLNKASDISVKEEGKEISFNFWQLQKHSFPIVETEEEKNFLH